MERGELRTTSIFDACPLKFSRQELCSGFAAIFRTPDGTCNNLESPGWGAAFMPFLRFLPPDYSDGIETFRRSRSNGPLPSPRLVSATIHRDVEHLTTQFTMMVMQWGQFLDHDLTSTPTTRGFNESILQCCSKAGHHHHHHHHHHHYYGAQRQTITITIITIIIMLLKGGRPTCARASPPGLSPD